MEPINIAIGNYGLTKALKDGTVGADDLKINFIEVDPVTTAMRRMVRSLEFDVCEMAFTTYLCAKAYGKPITALPIFLTRNFHHRAMVYNVCSGIKTPRDLEGRTVGVHRGYTVTTGLWARGILETEYGVHLKTITWTPTDDEHVSEYKAPSNVDYSFCGRQITDLLLSGEIGAAVGDIRTNAPEIRSLIPDPLHAGYAYFQRTGIYPINHAVVVKDSLLKADPGLARGLFNLFAAAKTLYLSRIDTGIGLSSADDATIALRKVVGDPFPFGIRHNRKALGAMIQFACDQQIIGTKFSIHDLFAPGSLDME